MSSHGARVELDPAMVSTMRLNPLFAWTDNGELGPLLAHVTTTRYVVSETVWSEHDASDAVSLILAGRVGVGRPGQDGKPTFLAFAGPGEFLGELSLFDKRGRQATAVALVPTTAVTIPHVALTEWMDRHPHTYPIFCGMLAGRVRRLIDTLEDSYGLDVATRLARALVRLGARFGHASSDGLHLDLTISQEHLAGHVRASRERISQSLAEFQRRGLIRRDAQNVLVVLDGPGLLARAQLRAEVVVRLGDSARFFTTG